MPIGWKRIEVETSTHIGITSQLIYTQQEFLAGFARSLHIIGIHVKPVVRVKMGRACTED